jgi:hypothetical protein
MIAPQIDAMAELQSAFRLLTKNLSLAVVPIVAALLCGVLFFGVFAIAAGGAGMSGLFSSDNGFDASMLFGALAGAAVWAVLAAIISGVITMISEAAVVEGSENALQGRAPDLGAAIGKAFAKIGDLLIFGLILGIVGGIVGVTFIGPIVVWFFMMFGLPAIMIGNESAFTAMGTSWKLTTQNFGPSASAFLGIFVVGICVFVASWIVGLVPIIGHFIGLALFGFLWAYAAVVAVRFYDILNRRSAPLPAAAMPSMSSSSMPTPAQPPPPPPPVSPSP